MAELNSLKDLFIHHVKDLYSAETNLKKASPALLNAAGNDRLKDIIKEHGKMIDQHIDNLESIARELGTEASGETCHAMLGLIKEAQQFLGEHARPAVQDAGIIADAQRIEHYFITGYGTLSNWSEQLGLSESVQKKCKQGVSDSEKLDNDLKELAKSRVNKEAMN